MGEKCMNRQKVGLVVRRVFGSGSEKLDSAQLQLQLLQLSEVPAVPEPLPAAPAKAPSAPRTRSPQAPRLPDNLQVVEEVIDPDPVRAQPENWRQIGQEVTEQLDFSGIRIKR